MTADNGPVAAGDRRAAVIARLRAAGCVFAEDEADLLLAATADLAELERLVEQRCQGLPLEHVLGWAEFGGLRLAVGPGTFVPRRRTEFLAHVALARMPVAVGRRPVVIDLCCGVGALGAVLLAGRPDIELVAADLDEVAARYARRNLGGTDAVVLRGDLFDALPAALRGTVDVLVVNLPYVPTASIALLPPEARAHEPRTALDGGPDGLAIYRRVVADAARWLRPGGRLFVELDESQVDAATSAGRSAGLMVETLDDPECEVSVLIAGRREDD